MKAPKTFLEAVRYFSDPQTCVEFLVALRWPNGVKCPQCGSKKVTFLENAKLWKCKNAHPKQKFSVKVGTIFEDSPIAQGHVHTNGLENFWSLLKRALHGTYVNVEPFHLFRYLDE